VLAEPENGGITHSREMVIGDLLYLLLNYCDILKGKDVFFNIHGTDNR
jgi:hypothetical protein